MREEWKKKRKVSHEHIWGGRDKGRERWDRDKEDTRRGRARESKSKRRGQAASFIVKHSWLLQGDCGVGHTWLLVELRKNTNNTH